MVRGRSALAASLAISGFGALSLAACSGVLGLKDLQPYPAEGGSDAAADSEVPDGAATDDGSDARGDAAAMDGESFDGPSPMDAPRQDGPAVDAPQDTSPPVDAPPDTFMTPDGPCGGPMDAHNCGTCGHDCLGGACSGGMCQPFVLTAGVTAYDLVAVSGSLYWVDQIRPSGSVWTCTVTGGTCNAHTLVTGQNAPERITSAAGFLYWTNYGTGGAADGSVMAYALSGGARSALATNLWTPEGIAADGANVFWAQSYSGAPAQIVRLQLSNSTSTPYLPSSTSSPTAVALGNGEVYWTESGDGNVAMSQESAWAASNVAVGQSAPWALSVDSSYVYWVDYASPGSVWQYGISSGSAVQLRTTEEYPIRVASDAAQAYWIDQGSTTTATGKLVGCDPATGATADLEPNLDHAASLAIDGTAVYFGTVGDSKLHMMVR